MSVHPAPQESLPDTPSVHDARTPSITVLDLLAMLILTLLLRLPGAHLAGNGSARARRLLLRRTSSLAAAFAPDAPGHAQAVALGVIPDWILPGYRNRGMRRTAEACPHAAIARSARAPPRAESVPRNENTLQPEGASSRQIHYDIKTYRYR